jgi:hypothetical protein
MHSNVKLQIAAIFCISNLVWREEAGSGERQARLRDLGVYKLLQQLIMTSDTLLFDKYVYIISGKANNVHVM